MWEYSALGHFGSITIPSLGEEPGVLAELLIPDHSEGTCGGGGSEITHPPPPLGPPPPPRASICVLMAVAEEPIMKAPTLGSARASAANEMSS